MPRKSYTFKNRITLTPQEKKQRRLLWLSTNKNRFRCNLCDFGSCNRSNLKKHYLRTKHLKNVKELKEKIEKSTRVVEKIIC